MLHMPLTAGINLCAGSHTMAEPPICKDSNPPLQGELWRKSNTPQLLYALLPNLFNMTTFSLHPVHVSRADHLHI